ncbi:amino acid transporter [Colletotrichum camelliae]|nr:amino acid transporter [Colletotrichum camelliae]
MASSSTKFLVFGSLAGMAMAASLPASNSSLTRGAVKEFPECVSLHERKSWTAMTDVEKKAYIDAELCLQNKAPKLGVEGSQNLWDDLMYAHIYQANVIHNDGPFLPWHRLYMRVHEVYLQTECGYEGGQPYWNELEDAEAGFLNQSTVFDAETGFGSFKNGENGCVADGPFVNLTMHLNQTSNNADFCLTRDLDQDSFYQANSTYVNECMAIDTYVDSWNCWGTAPHLAGHMGVGGTMLDVVSSPGDPLFFLHHTNLDRLWWEWQSVNLTARLNEMGGPVVASDAFLEMSNLEYPGADLLDYNGENGGNVTTMAHNLWTAGLLPNITIADLMDVRGPISCAIYV